MLIAYCRHSTSDRMRLKSRYKIGQTVFCILFNLKFNKDTITHSFTLLKWLAFCRGRKYRMTLVVTKRQGMFEQEVPCEIEKKMNLQNTRTHMCACVLTHTFFYFMNMHKYIHTHEKEKCIIAVKSIQLYAFQIGDQHPYFVCKVSGFVPVAFFRRIS